MKKFAFLVLFFGCYFTVASLNAREITLVTECNQPCDLRTSDGLPNSLPTSVVLALFERTKDSPQIKVMPWARAYESALTEPNIFIYSMSKTKDREPLFKWIGDILIEKYFIWGLQDKVNQSYEDSEDFRHRSFATHRSSSEFDYITKLPGVVIHPVVYPNQRIQMLLAKRVDFFIESEQTLLETCDQLKFDCKKIHKITEVKSLNTPLSIAINKSSDPELVEQYQKAFAAMSASGQLQKIVQHWQQ